MKKADSVTLDEQGRLIVPAPLHHRLGLSRGIHLVVEEENDEAAFLRVQQSSSRLIDKGGVLVVRTVTELSITDVVCSSGDGFS